MYTIEDFDRANQALALVEKALANYDGGNPRKHQSEFERLSAEVARIDRALKLSGQLPSTEAEKLQFELDRRYPGSNSGRVVEFEGQRYVRRYSPLHASLSGKTVHAWEGWWELFESLPAGHQLQYRMKELFPGAASGQVVKVGSELYCYRVYHFNDRSSLWWKAVSDLQTKEQIKCKLDFRYPHARAGRVVELEGQSYKRCRTAGDQLCWREVKNLKTKK